MMAFIQELKIRNEALYYFGLLNFVAAILMILLAQFTSVKVYNVNAWYKPIKFALSIGMYAWTMAWYIYYLPSFNTGLFNIAIIVLLGFELVYIVLQAARGQLSHYNISTPFYASLYVLMALAASLVTIYTLYVGILFFKTPFPELPVYYLWSIRLGIIIFVVFSFQGFVMGSRMTHTIGGPDGEAGLPFLNWSYRYGDPRVAHFIGMHALQVLPLLSFYLLRNTRAVFIVSIVYALLATFTLIQALNGEPVKKEEKRGNVE
jgi:hypothetical protein